MSAALRLLTLSERDRRTIAVGATCILFMILVAKVLPAERRWDTHVEMRVAVLEREVADARSMMSRETATRDAVAKRTRALRMLEAGLLRAETKSGGETSLAALVSTAAATAGIKLDGLSLDSDAGDNGRIRTASVTGGATGDIQGLAMFLGALESTQARLAVRALSVTQSDVASPETRAEALRLEFTVQAQVITAERMIP